MHRTDPTEPRQTLYPAKGERYPRAIRWHRTYLEQHIFIMFIFSCHLFFLIAYCMEGLRCLAGVPQLDHKGFIYRAFCLSWVRPVRWWDMGYMGLPHGNPEIHSKSIQIPWFIPWFIRQYQTFFFPVTSPFTKAKSEPWLCCTRWHKMRPLSIPDVKWSFCTGTVEVCSFCQSADVCTTDIQYI